MAIAKTKTKVVRILLVDAMGKEKETISTLAFKVGVDRTMIYNMINCRRDGDFSLWKKIQEVLSLKDSEMWAIITTTKRIYR